MEVLCVLRLPYTSQKTQANRKENEHVENSLRQPCDLVFRTAVLRCSILHREAVARNPEICRRGQVHGCRKADVTQALPGDWARGDDSKQYRNYTVVTVLKPSPCALSFVYTSQVDSSVWKICDPDRATCFKV